MSSKKSYYAVTAGLCASGGSFFGKLTGDEQILFGLENIWIIRVICFALMVLCNALVWTFFVKAVHSTSGTLTATVTSAATNYFLSFLLGALVFKEHITLLSLMGTSLILVGLIFLTKDSNSKEKNS